ncbi:MAG: hypothetical protein KME11_13410 [Timaviella obliquedivisa GSE-PSE-MK23-08B]|jgi:hypothetical protein|nr:hypothetical protein [Timaviella obliquedivisa GSE-PSE-MK23-08B]
MIWSHSMLAIATVSVLAIAGYNTEKATTDAANYCRAKPDRRDQRGER